MVERGIIGRAARRRTVFAGAAGNALEWYDFTIYGFAAPVIGRLFFPSDDPVASLLAAYGVFASAFLVRPLGSLVFGHIADRRGRKAALMISVAMMALSTVAIGLLPTHASIGVAAPVLLVACRLLQGLSVGGEFTTSITLLGEGSPPGRRGLLCALPSCTVGVGQVLGSLAFFLVQAALPPDTVASWGWRVPFLFGIVLGIATLWLRRALLTDEAPPPAARGLPIVAAFRLEGRAMACGFLMSVLAGVAIYLGVIALPVFVNRHAGLSLETASGIGTLATGVLIVVGPGFGALSDRIGRRRVMSASAVAFIVLALPLFWLFTRPQAGFVVLGEILYMVVLAAYISPLGAMLAELFSAPVRGSGTAFSYNLALGLFGGTTPAVIVALTTGTGRPVFAALWLVAAAIVGLVGVRMAPERAGQPLDAGSPPHPRPRLAATDGRS